MKIRIIKESKNALIYILSDYIMRHVLILILYIINVSAFFRKTTRNNNYVSWKPIVSTEYFQNFYYSYS